jgi:hypothetical protein
VVIQHQVAFFHVAQVVARLVIAYAIPKGNTFFKNFSQLYFTGSLFTNQWFIACLYDLNNINYEKVWYHFHGAWHYRYDSRMFNLAQFKPLKRG